MFSSLFTFSLFLLQLSLETELSLSRKKILKKEREKENFVINCVASLKCLYEIYLVRYWIGIAERRTSR